VTEPAANDKLAAVSLTERLRRQDSRLLLLNPGQEPTPVSEDQSVHALLDLVAPGGKIHVCREPGGTTIGELRRKSGGPDGGPALLAAVAAGIYNPGQAPQVVAEEGFMEMGNLWARIVPGGFLGIHSPRPGERSGIGIDLRQRLIDWLESLPPYRSS
jgi:hypothetical protein